MEIEEIKCPLCQQLYNEHEKIPILLPECGHSYCYECVKTIFDEVHLQQIQYNKDYQEMIEFDQKFSDQLNLDSEDLNLNDDNEEDILASDVVDKGNKNKAENYPKKQIALFRCPDDEQNIFFTYFFHFQYCLQYLESRFIAQELCTIKNHSKNLGKCKNLFDFRFSKIGGRDIKYLRFDVKIESLQTLNLKQSINYLNLITIFYMNKIDLQESIIIKKKKIVKLDFNLDDGQFVVTRPEDKTLAGFLTSGSPEKIMKNTHKSERPSLIENSQINNKSQLNSQQQDTLYLSLTPIDQNTTETTLDETTNSIQQTLQSPKQIQNNQHQHAKQEDVPVLEYQIQDNLKQQQQQQQKMNIQNKQLNGKQVQNTNKFQAPNNHQVQQDPPQLENCQTHQRPAELICVDDMMRICAQCALFGQHKGHDVRMEEDVTKEISLKVEVIMEMYQAMENSCDELNIQDNYEKHYNIYKAKQNEMKEKIQEKFKEWRNALRAVEMKAIDSLYVNFAQFEEKFTLARNHNNKLIAEAQSWMDKAKLQLDDYTNKTTLNPFYIPFEMIDNKKNNAADDILTQGEFLLEKTEKQKGFPSLNGLDSQYSTVKVSFDPNVEKKLQNIAKVYSSNGQNQNDMSEDFTTNSGSFPPPFSYPDEEDLNDGGLMHVKQTLANEALNLSNISFNEPASPINTGNSGKAVHNRPPPLSDLEELKDHQEFTPKTQSNHIHAKYSNVSASAFSKRNGSHHSSNNNTVLSSEANSVSVGNSSQNITLTAPQSTSNQQLSLSQSKLRRFSTLNKPGSQSQSSGNNHQQPLNQQNTLQPNLQHQSSIQPTSTVQNSSGAKKKNDLPSAFKNEAGNGELDLSNRSKQLKVNIKSHVLDLSDMHSNDLAKCIKQYSGHIRILNLSKNRISDEGILHIIKALCESHIEIISLSTNKLSEKCVEGIVGCLKTNKSIKQIDLSNNSISSRLMKNKLKNGLPQIDVIV